MDINQSPEEFLPSFCKVIQLFQHHPDCSGALVGPNIVVTAAHCVETDDDKRFLQVECGYQKTRSKLKPTFTAGVHKIKKDPSYHSDTTHAIYNDTFLSEASIDFAFLVLNRPTKITPLEVPGSLDDATARFFTTPSDPKSLDDRILKSGVECRYAGFGRDTYFHGGDPSLAKIFAGESENYDLTISFGFAQEGIDSFAVGKPYLRNQPKNDVTTGPKNQMMEGDSGGPMICRENASAPWVLLGINSRTLQPDHYLDPVIENGHARAKLDLTAGAYNMAFAPTFSPEYRSKR